MQRALLGFAYASVLILFVACGGGGGTVPVGTTIATQTTASASGAATGSGNTLAPSDTGSTSGMPDLPLGAIALTEYHVFPPTADKSSILFTLPVTQTPPTGAKTYWYTYSGGKWTQLQEAYITGLRELQAQGSFDTTPDDLIVLAVPS